MIIPSFAERLDNFLARYLAYFNYRDYIERIDLQGDENVLELGSGGGNLSRFIARKIPKGNLYCVDISQYWTKRAKRRLRKFRNITCLEKSIEMLSIENGCLDVAIIHYVLHDISKKQRGKIIKIISNKLRKNGRIHVREPTRKSHGISPKEIRELMLSEGFLEQASKEGYSFPLRGKVYKGIFEKRLLS